MNYEIMPARTTKEKTTLEIYFTKSETELIILAHIKKELEKEGIYYRDDNDKVHIRSGKGRGWEVIIEARRSQ